MSELHTDTRLESKNWTDAYKEKVKLHQFFWFKSFHELLTTFIQPKILWKNQVVEIYF